MIASTWIQTLGLTLLHSLWQGALLGALYAAARRMLKHQSAQSRYLLGVITLAGLLVWQVSTLLALWPQPMFAFPDVDATALSPQALYALLGNTTWSDRLLQLSPVLGMGWFLGVGFLILKWSMSYYQVQVLRKKGQIAPDNELITLLEKARQRLRIHPRVELYFSQRVTSPLTLGFFRPMILIPLSLASGLTPQQWEAILLHELAHIKRADYLVNLFQSWVEILFFYHPVVWWLSGEIQREREACCDDLAVSASGDTFGYAETLIRLQRFRFTNQIALTMPLSAKNGGFTDRIQRLFAPRQNRVHPRMAALLALACMATLLSQSLPAWAHPQESSRNLAPATEKPVVVQFPTEGEPLYLINGIEVSKSVVDQLNPNTIESVNVLKGESATKAYGERAKNGVVLIVLTQDQKKPGSADATSNPAPPAADVAPTAKVTSSPAPASAPLRVSATSPTAATAPLAHVSAPANAAPVAALAITRSDVRMDNDVEERSEITSDDWLQRTAVISSDASPLTNNQISGEQLIIIDGKPSTAEDVEKLNPSSIYSINVLKGETALQTGLQGSGAGVIIITTKGKKK